MTQIFEDGKCVPVTVVEAGPNFVLQKKTEEKDGYVALQLGFDEKKEKRKLVKYALLSWEFSMFLKYNISITKYI